VNDRTSKHDLEKYAIPERIKPMYMNDVRPERKIFAEDAVSPADMQLSDGPGRPRLVADSLQN
jgi:hypothetical protein